ncbi:hypothetical protein DRH29_02160 [candidate division Kazan bacterium]|uniref:Uncharacterized protein n=1 Tax=candidate division Kazan bacterium TaxID=2202143 RepID=A0A420ZCW5_UNCK3|nr:MAG: hypothetical protein DRH29_02160 [candidate division Kazan bacterium]
MEIEENISQEEMNEEGNNPSDIEGENLKIKEPKVPTPEPPKRKMGVMLTVFAAVIIVLIGGLASYYYYNFQSQGLASSKVLENVWDETVLVSIELTNAFEQIETFDDMATAGRDSFEAEVNDANRTIRDGIFDIRGQTGLNITASTFASKLNSFLDDYSKMLAELKRIVSRAEDIDSIDELDQLLIYGENMEKSYDDMLLVGNDYVQANLPRIIFNLPTNIKGLLEEKIREYGTQEEQDKAERQAAEQVVSQFAEAWRNRDSEGMLNYLTSGAKASDANKIAGLMEDSSDIDSFRILNTTIVNDTNIEIRSSLEKITPDNSNITEEWKFVLLKTNGSWLIDTWVQQ